MITPGVTIVTQTRVMEGATEAFGRFQASISAAIGGQAGFLEQSVLPPRPPLQTDWVILQRFTTAEAATAWLQSAARQMLLAEVAPLLAGLDDVHLVRDEAAGVLPAPVSVVFTTRVRPGMEAAYRLWEQKIAAAQSRAPGFEGYRFEAPIPGVQAESVAILRFGTEAALQGWMGSAERLALVAEAEAGGLVEQVRSRFVQSGFSQWFAAVPGKQPAAWKQNMIVLLLLYPVVFLFGLWVQTPVLMGLLHMPFWAALFVSNGASVLLLNVLVPRVTGLFGWWLEPAPGRAGFVGWAGAALVAVLYAVWLGVFALAS